MASRGCRSSLRSDRRRIVNGYGRHPQSGQTAHCSGEPQEWLGFELRENCAQNSGRVLIVYATLISVAVALLCFGLADGLEAPGCCGCGDERTNATSA